ncbi:MAG: DegT/DnrJ/EryC1/StrS aminotransferase family protein [Candidatus Omnitrophota bacterium]
MTKICRGRISFSGKYAKVFLGALFLSNKQGKVLLAEFENQFSLYIQRKQAIAVSCAKTALSLSLKILKAQAGDEIIVPGYTVTEVIDVIISNGLKPVFVDISLQDGNMIPELIEQKITCKTKFILMTHIHGNPCEIDSIISIAKKYGIRVIEDAAQACGAEYKGKKIGSFGKIAYFSFNLFKNLNTLGGSMIVTDDHNLAAKIRQLVSEFKPISKRELIKRFFIAGLLAFFTKPFIFSWLGYPGLRLMGRYRDKNIKQTLKVKSLNKTDLNKFNVSFSPAQASLGLLRIKDLDELNQQKINNAKVLNEKLSIIKQIGIFNSRENIKNIYLNYVIRVADRQELIKFLFDQGIDISPGFVQACAYLKEFAAYASACPNSLILERENVYLPVYLPLTEKDMVKIAKSIEKYYESKTTI